MIINQTTTLIFEYPQDYLQEQEWCKTKEDRWIHKGTDTLGAVYENTISYSIGQPNCSEKPNNCEEPQIQCFTCGLNKKCKTAFTAEARHCQNESRFGKDEPQTEEWYTYQDEQEYNARHGKE